MIYCPPHFIQAYQATLRSRLAVKAKPSNINKAQIIAMAKLLGFKPQYVLKIAEEISNNLLDVLITISDEISTMASVGTEKTMVERLNQHISSHTKSFQKRLFSN